MSMRRINEQQVVAVKCRYSQSRGITVYNNSHCTAYSIRTARAVCGKIVRQIVQHSQFNQLEWLLFGLTARVHLSHLLLIYIFIYWYIYRSTKPFNGDRGLLLIWKIPETTVNIHCSRVHCLLIFVHKRKIYQKRIRIHDIVQVQVKLGQWICQIHCLKQPTIEISVSKTSHFWNACADSTIHISPLASKLNCVANKEYISFSFGNFGCFFFVVISS